MGHNDRRRWLPVGDALERAAPGGQTWRIRPVGAGWRLDRIDPAGVDWLGSPSASEVKPIWDADSQRSCIEMVRHIELHQAYFEKASKVQGSLTVPTRVDGITVHATRTGTRINATAVEDGTGREVGSYRADLSNWTTAWVLGEPTFDGGYSVRPHLIGKGIGLALFEAVEKLAVVSLTPHGRYGAQGGQSPYSLAFWEKRAQHRRVPGLGDPAVAARDAERTKVQMILAMASGISRARDPEFVAAVACATGWDVVHVPTSDGDCIQEAWCIRPDETAFSGVGPDDGIPAPLEDSSEGDAPVSVRTDAAAYLAKIEAMLLEGSPDLGDDRGHRSYIAAMAMAASVVLDRHAGMAVSAPSLKAAILAPEPGMLQDAIALASSLLNDADDSMDDLGVPTGPVP